MKTTRQKYIGDSEPQRRDGPLNTDDVARYLHNEARKIQEERTGNPALSGELRRLSEMLRAHGKRPISELAITDKGAKLPFAWHPGVHPTTGENGKPTSRKRHDPNGKAVAPPLRRTTSILPDNPESLSREEVEEILEDDRLTKRDIAELGHARFGISKPSLLRARKDRAINTILVSLRNERTMHVIAEQARKAGMMRSA